MIKAQTIRVGTQDELHQEMLRVQREHPNAVFDRRGVTTNDWGGEFWWATYKLKKKQ